MTELKELLNITEIIIQKVNLQPGDVLFVTFPEDRLNPTQLKVISNSLQTVFRKNKVVCSGIKMDISAASSGENGGNH